MARHNTAAHAPLRTAPTTGARAADTTNHEGTPAHTRDPKTELYLLAVAYMGTGAFYETADNRAGRYRALVRQVAVEDPDWTARFLPWLRRTVGMRAASVEGGVEAAYAMTRAGIPGGRDVLASALQRADEPAEALAYARATYGRTLPRAVDNGLRDACTRLYTEFSAGKWDSAEGHYRFGDMIRMLHPRPANPEQAHLFRWLSRTRTNRRMAIPLDLRMVRAARATRKALLTRGSAALAEYTPQQLQDHLKAAGLTWEDLVSIAGERGNDLDARTMWELVAPYAGYHALVKNLRRMDELGVSDAVAAQVAARIADPEQARRARMLPLGYYSAFRAVRSLRWGHALEQGLNHTLGSIPALAGRTLVLVDRSNSMFWDSLEALRGRVRKGVRLTGYSFKDCPAHHTSLADAAAIFGSAIALRAEHADLWQFGTSVAKVQFRPGDSVLRMAQTFTNAGGTAIAEAVEATYAGHDRVIIITDEQEAVHARWTDALRRRDYDVLGQVEERHVVPERVPIYTWNLAGYAAGYLPHRGNRFVFGGLSDHSFSMVSQLETGGNGTWPF